MDTIEKLNGLEEVKAMVRTWEQLRLNAGEIPKGMPIVIPNYLWVTKSGTGNTMVLKLISEYLSSTGLMEFYGDVKFFEFRLDYSPTAEDAFPEFTRLMQEIEFAAGFRHDFKGIAAIDITQWAAHTDSAKLTALLEFLSANSDNMLLVFVLYSGEQEAIAEMERKLSAYLRIKKITLDFPAPEVFADFIKRKIEGFGFTVDNSASELLEASIGDLIKEKTFDGYKTVERICIDIVFDLFAEQDFKGYAVDKNRLAAYACGSRYIERAKETAKERSIGFNTGCDR